jgi:hypothetical protein
MLKAVRRSGPASNAERDAHQPLPRRLPGRAKRVSDICWPNTASMSAHQLPDGPTGTLRLRFTPGRVTAEMMDELTKALIEIWSQKRSFSRLAR